MNKESEKILKKTIFLTLNILQFKKKKKLFLINYQGTLKF